MVAIVVYCAKLLTKTNTISSNQERRMTYGEYVSSDEIGSMRDDFDFAHAIMRHAVKHNLSDFSFAGLRIPPVLQTWGQEHELLKTPGFSEELVVFQEHLYDRIVSLADNKRMLQEIWEFNERSRAFREIEFEAERSATKAIGEIADLMNALFVHDAELTLQILDRSLQRRLVLIAGQADTVLAFPEVRRRK